MANFLPATNFGLCIFNVVFHGSGPIKLIVLDKSFT
jgi:hypothetical protein